MTETAKAPRRSRAEAREQAMNQIIDIATQEFVEKGLAGARIDEIAGRATKRKIYYYFEGKDELYRAVLERAYRRVRDSEGRVDISVRAIRMIGRRPKRSASGATSTPPMAMPSRPALNSSPITSALIRHSD